MVMKHPRRVRRGSMYVAVLGVAVIVTAMGLGILFAARVQGATNSLTTGTIDARLCAEAGIDSTAYYLAVTSNWRGARSNGTWFSNITFGDGTFTITGTDPVDGNLGNRPTDPLVVRVTGTRASAVHTTEVTVRPSGTPISSLGAAISTVGQFRTASGRTMNLNGATAFTSGTFRNDGTVNGRVECLLATGSGTVTGTTTVLAAGRTMPTTDVFSLYADLGRTISTGGTLDKFLLTPGVNSLGGGTSTDGVYVLNLSSNITLRNFRVQGTLVILANGKDVTIDGPGLLQTARTDYPALIVSNPGRLTLKASSAVSLSEASTGFNFNPSGAAYSGAADSDLSDTYPSEIQGLVHTNGQLQIENFQRVRGAVISTSNASSDAIAASDCEIVYDPALFTSPPMGYASSYTMKIVPGSWKQVVSP
jgi:hypothetical protein